MKRFLMAFLALGFCCCWSIPEVQAKTTKSSKSSKTKKAKKKQETKKTALPANWLTDVEKAKAQAAQEKKPYMIVFNDPLIGEKFQRTVMKDKEFVKLTQNVIPVYLEYPRKRSSSSPAEKWKELYSVTSYPAAVVLSSEGQELGRLHNTDKPEEFNSMLKESLRGLPEVKAAPAQPAKKGKTPKKTAETEEGME